MRLSQNKNRNKNKNYKVKIEGKNKLTKSKLFVRGMALLLVILMFLGVVVSLIPFGGFSVSAMDGNPSSEIIRVGLMYGSDVTTGFEVKAPNGFFFGALNDTNQYSVLWQVTDMRLSVACDANLSKKGEWFYKSSSNIIIGGYHVQLENGFSSKTELSSYLSQLNDKLSPVNTYAFPIYIDGKYKIRVGAYNSESDALFAKDNLTSIIGNCSVVMPTQTAVSVVNPDTNIILFEFDGNNVMELGMTPIQSGSETAYIQTPAKNTYGGIFEYKRFIDSSNDGIAVTNVIPLEEYIEGVLPWEISNSWHVEVQKAFAITVRSFTLSMMQRHNKTYGFDLCNTTHCQAYLGRVRVNHNVTSAVEATKGMVITYNGKIAETYYTAISGGVTISAAEAWGGNDIPYLRAISTPWEKYSEYSRGSWSVEVSPTDLLNALRNKNYTQLNGEVADIKINSFAKNSTYVYSITITDSYGTQVTIDTSDKIRTVFGKYLSSGNFVVGRGGSSIEVIDFVPINKNSSQADANTQVYSAAQINNSIINVLTSNGKKSMTLDGELKIETSNGPITLKDIENVYNLDILFGKTTVPETVPETTVPETVPETTAPETVPETTAPETVPETTAPETVPETTAPETVPETTAPETVPETTAPVLPILPPPNAGYQVVTKTVIAEGSHDNFVFIGKGWGHGVGMSQYGSKDMAELGYHYSQILSTYFPGTSIMHYSKANME